MARRRAIGATWTNGGKWGGGFAFASTNQCIVVATNSAALKYYATNVMVLEAVKRAGKVDGPSIKDALKATDMAVVSGQVKFDGDRNPIKSAVVIEIKGGKFVYRSTVNP